MLRKLKRKNGQSTLEYVLLLTGITLVFLTILGRGGFFSSALNQTVTDMSGHMNSYSEFAAGKIGAGEPPVNNEGPPQHE